MSEKRGWIDLPTVPTVDDEPRLGEPILLIHDGPAPISYRLAAGRFEDSVSGSNQWRIGDLWFLVLKWQPIQLPPGADR